MIRRALLAIAALFALLVAALAFNTLQNGSRQLAVQPLPPLAVDEASAAESLAAAVRFKTISGLVNPEATAREFAALHEHLRARYPLVHSKLELETIAGASLLYTWKGSETTKPPIALMAHQDVVPIAPGTESLWKQPPFDGKVEGGFVWGRGTWDDKGNLIAQLEAVESLLKAGFAPKRTVYLAFGHDEEVGGRQGAAAIAALLAERKVRLEFVLDEGMLVTEKILPGIEAPIALIGVAEKGYASFTLAANAAPGHSSMPPAPGQSAIAVLSVALAKLDANPLPGGLAGVAARMFDTVAPEMSFVQRVVLGNRWLFGPIVENQLERSASTNALMRTTTAITIVNAGNKDNVLPGRAEAVVNFRLLPGDTVANVEQHMKRVIADPRIEVKALGTPSGASPVSSDDSEAYRQIARSVREVFPGAVVAPGLVLGGTDAKHFSAVADNVYRFSPVRAKAEDLPRFHGTDERLSTSNLAEMIRFYHRLLQRTAGNVQQGPAP